MLTWLSIWVPIIGGFIAMCFMTWLLFWDRPASEPVPESPSQGSAPLPEFDRLDDALWYILQMAKVGIPVPNKAIYASVIELPMADGKPVGFHALAEIRDKLQVHYGDGTWRKGSGLSDDALFKAYVGQQQVKGIKPYEVQEAVLKYLASNDETKEVFDQINQFKAEYAA